MTRIVYDPATTAYINRQMEEGLRTREAMRSCSWPQVRPYCRSWSPAEGPPRPPRTTLTALPPQRLGPVPQRRQYLFTRTVS
jgi:hypothetical protein